MRGQQRNGSIGIVINCADQNRGRKLEDTDKLAILVSIAVCEVTEVGLAMEAAPAAAMEDPLGSA